VYVWWKEMVQIRNGVGLEVGSRFEENIQIKVGNGVDTFFRWTGG